MWKLHCKNTSIYGGLLVFLSGIVHVLLQAVAGVAGVAVVQWVGHGSFNREVSNLKCSSATPRSLATLVYKSVDSH